MAAEKFFNLSPYSFHPPVLPDPDATSPRPDWVFLDTKAYISDRTNGTTATAFASNGVQVDVTFWIADPPVFSHFSVHCKEFSDFAEEPRIICSDKNVAVLCLYWMPTTFARYEVLRDYFVYTARSSKNAAPSLIRLPDPSPRVFNPLEMGLLPAADGEGFVIAVIRPQEMFPGLYDLHIFLSKNWRWDTKYVLLEPQYVGKANINKHKTDKVIPLTEEGSLGWVDLWRGILLCNVLDDNPVVRFIPLPKPMPRNKDIEDCPWLHRDVTYINGLIKFVELETRENGIPKNDLPDHMADMQFDSDLVDDNMCAIENNTDVTVSWTAVAWVRKTSEKAWIKGCEAKLDDIAINCSTGLSHLLPPLENLITSAPTLSICGDDVVVYLMSKLKINDDNAWVIALNMTRNTLEGLALLSAKRIFSFNTTYRPCSLSKHLDMTAINRKAGFQMKEDDSESTTVLVDWLDPCINEDQLRCIFTKSGEIGHVQMLHKQCASVKFIHRCSAANAICEFDGYLIGRNCVRVSWKSDTTFGLQTRDGQSYHQYPQFSGVNSCNHTVEATFVYRNRTRSEGYGYHLQQLKLQPLPFRSTDGALQG